MPTYVLLSRIETSNTVKSSCNEGSDIPYSGTVLFFQERNDRSAAWYAEGRIVERKKLGLINDVSLPFTLVKVVQEIPV
jgi:hypothetical protein